VTVWQRLGAFVATAENLGDDALSRFGEIGGAWVVPVLYGDDASGPYNLANIDSLKHRAAMRGVTVGCWANGWAGDPHNDAIQIAAIVGTHDLDPVIVDCEAAYQQHPDVFPWLLKDLRLALPHSNLAVSTNSLNDSLIWNGRGLNPQESARRLGYRVLPQWYSSPNYSGAWTDPVANMAWLSGPGGTSDNLRDVTYANKRAVPLSYVHGTLEVTGLEDASLAVSLGRCTEARKYGLTAGLSVYLLENMPDTDYALLARQRGTLYL
jgi:hypothetical protein